MPGTIDLEECRNGLNPLNLSRGERIPPIPLFPRALDPGDGWSLKKRGVRLIVKEGQNHLLRCFDGLREIPPLCEIVECGDVNRPDAGQLLVESYERRPKRSSSQIPNPA